MDQTTKTYVIVAVAILFLFGLLKISSLDKADSGITDRKGYGTICLNGVTYYSSSSRLAPAFNIDGSLIECE